jgi:ferredoxin--NADP+ reductase
MDECPVDAIHGEWDLPDDLDDYLAINADYFVDNPIEPSSPADRSRRSIPAGSELRVAVVGSGPAGCYAASELSDIKGVEVSVFDRLPTPFGLVRAGVAPDHSNTKLIAKRFDTVLGRPNVHCYFNVEVGNDLSVEELLSSHHAVIWAAGTSGHRQLGIDGEELEGCVPAQDFVAWYNGHPDYASQKFDLSGDTAIVIGNGNVALDVARILAQPSEQLERTDIAEYALERLAESRVRKVIVTGRRGPEYAAYTAGELAALIHTDGVHVAAHADETAELEGRAGRPAQLVRELPDDSDRTNSIVLRYGLVPQAINGRSSVESVDFLNSAGDLESIAASLVVTAIGYRGTPVPGLPFDDSAGTLPNVAGRVLDPVSGYSLIGVYCSGWIKRGPSGMIGTNKADSAETVEMVLHDFLAGQLPTPILPRESVGGLLADRGVHVIGRAGWSEIDRVERAAGRSARRPRLKIVTTAELLRTADGLGS